MTATPRDLRYAIREVLIHFLLAVEERDLRKTPPTDEHGGTWPDLSDIYDETDRRLRAAFAAVEHEVYLRDAEGATFYLPLRDGLKEWLSDAGYRLTFKMEETEGVAVTLRRGTSRDTDIDMLDQFLSQRSVECLVTVVGLDAEAQHD